AVLDAVRERIPEELMDRVFGRISFFVNAGVRFIEEHAKLRAMSALWDELGRERYGVTDPAHRRFRYGVQVNSLGLTEAQPENNVQRIILEMLAVTLSRDARARAIQLPAWNEALGLPRPEDQQWSLRIQQVLAYESDLLEYGDLFDGSPVVEAKTAELVAGAQAELAEVEAQGGMVPAVESGFLKGRLVAADAARPGVNLMEATLACARAGVTTGEWSAALRDVFGEYRAPTGLSALPVTPTVSDLQEVRDAVRKTAAELGTARLRLLLGKPGL